MMFRKITLATLALAAAAYSQASYNVFLNAQGNIFFGPSVIQTLDQTNGIRGVSNVLLNSFNNDNIMIDYNIRFGYSAVELNLSTPSGFANGFFEARFLDTVTVSHPFNMPVTLRFAMPTFGEPVLQNNMTNANYTASLEVGGQVRIICEYGKFLNEFKNNPPGTWEQTFPSGSVVSVRHRVIARANPNSGGASTSIDFGKGSFVHITPISGGSITTDSGATYSPIGPKPRM